MLHKLVTSANDSFQLDDPQTPGQQLRREMVTTRGRAAAMEEEVRNSPMGSRTGTPKADDSNLAEDATPLARKGRNANGGGSGKRSTRSSGAVEDFEVELTPKTNGKKSPAREKDEDKENEVEEEQNAVLGDTQIVEATEVVEIVEKEGETPKRSVRTSLNTTTPIISKHKRFGNEEPVVELEEKVEVTIEEKSEAINNEADESSDDDDAPEEVNTNDAVKLAKEKAREATKAADEQAALIKKKRQEKDAILKRQAVASSKKRKLETDSPETMLPPAQKTKVDSSPSEQAPEAETEPADDIEIESNTLDGDGTADSRLNDDSENDIEEIRRTFAPPLSRRPLPDLLPEELLEDDDEETSEQEGAVNGGKKQKKIQKRNLLAALGEKKIKDKRLGNTTFRVVEKRSEYLAPKASANSKGLKEAWLQGRGKGGVVFWVEGSE
ncbi:hypothetical protein CJF30_00006823 [Rutstroemia sp. NJR-2017a BBW]|nr:hypothetical protein CJF30_00006823 [Rutstroemia sp. NJR-2017a BBW]